MDGGDCSNRLRRVCARFVWFERLTHLVLREYSFRVIAPSRRSSIAEIISPREGYERPPVLGRHERGQAARSAAGMVSCRSPDFVIFDIRAKPIFQACRIGAFSRKVGFTAPPWSGCTKVR